MLMIREKSLAAYRNKPALVTDVSGDGKIGISVLNGEKLKVREKDIELLHPGPCAPSDLEGLGEAGRKPAADVRGAWELLEDTASSGAAVPLRELAELVYGAFSPLTAWLAWELLREGLYFTGDAGGIKARPAAEVEADEKKLEEKLREGEERELFLERLKKLLSSASPATALPTPVLPATDRRFLQDVEALALGKTAKSRTLKELGRNETPQEAHRLLLAAGVWTVWENPYPSRFGLSTVSAGIVPAAPPEEDRRDLTHLEAFAIDNPWSDDPDDAVSLEGPDSEGRCCLWVHVADPAASISPGSPADIEARGRGATLYLPEGGSRMLAPEALTLFALGLVPDRRSPALSFKITLDKNLSIIETEIFPSWVRVTRLTYGEADMSAPSGGAGRVPAGLFHLAERNIERRLNTGAVLIELPEVHITVSSENGKNRVSIEPLPSHVSADMVRECMVLAGEGAARWALRNKVPFPFIWQEAGDLPGERLPGLAGAWQMRRCMRPRTVSAKPGVHWGLGLDEYTQVTSPLRRYTDLLCHQQIRAFLRGEPLLSEEEVLLRVSAAEAAASAVSRAERASRAHWTAVYLSERKDSVWEGVVLDRKGSRVTAVIPALGVETQVNLRGDARPNDTVPLVSGQVRIPEGEVVFSCLENSGGLLPS
jgi:exoribonuclease-2